MRKSLVVILLVLVLLCAPVFAALPNSSMISLLHFNNSTGFYDENGDTWYNLTGTGKVDNMVTHTGFSNSANFTGSGYITIGNSSKRVLGNNYTLELWVYPTGAGKVYVHHVGALWPSMQWIYDNANTRMQFYSSSAASSWDIMNAVSTSTGSVPLNTWTHVEMDRFTPYYNIYINGILNNSISNVNNPKIQTQNITYSGDTAFNGRIDEVVLWGITLHTSNFTPNSQEYATPVMPISADFTQSANPSMPGQVVTFTDTSTGSPTTWNWSINTVVTNTTQNIAYAFPSVGTYYVNLSVTNATGSISNSNQTHTVGNTTGFTQQDVWMAGQYLQTFTITDSGTLAPITNVTIVSSSGKTYVTTNGTGYLTEPFGLYTVTFSSTGYSPRTITYVFDADESHAVALTPAEDSTNAFNTWYTPWQVRIRIVDLYGKPLPETSVSASYIATTLPSTDPTWLVGAYGVSDAVAADMLNSSMAMSGTTDDNGGLVFTAFKSIQYLFTITNVTSGVSATKKIYPSDPEYVIYVRTTGQTSYNNTLATRNASLPWYSINSTALMMGMEYTDSSVCTSQVLFRAWFRDNGTEVHNTTWSGFGGTKILDNHTILKAPIGTEYLWGYNATTVC
jgi:hypothetical protein